MKTVLVLLWPLLLVNIIMWLMYAHVPAIAAVCAIAMVGSPWLLPDDDVWRM